MKIRKPYPKKKIRKSKVTTAEMEVALQQYFDVTSHRSCSTVPNISWGLGLHECDLLIMSKSGYLTEVEIKVSISDLKKDLEKGHKHESNKIKFLFFAIPCDLDREECLKYIPERAGVLIVGHKWHVVLERPPKPNKESRKLSDKEQLQFYRLGSMRIWTLKRNIINLRRNLKELRREIKHGNK